MAAELDRRARGGSLVAPLVVGIALADLLDGVPIDGDQENTGAFGDLFGAYPVLTGVTLVLLSLLHGAAFLVHAHQRRHPVPVGPVGRPVEHSPRWPSPAW